MLHIYICLICVAILIYLFIWMFITYMCIQIFGSRRLSRQSTCNIKIEEKPNLKSNIHPSHTVHFVVGGLVDKWSVIDPETTMSFGASSLNDLQLSKITDCSHSLHTNEKG